MNNNQLMKNGFFACTRWLERYGLGQFRRVAELIDGPVFAHLSVPQKATEIARHALPGPVGENDGRQMYNFQAEIGMPIEPDEMNHFIQGFVLAVTHYDTYSRRNLRRSRSCGC